ncbi:hypothetical protein [Streptomyces sp. SID5910]|uniref:hypothetical protein n=1 Tax=Streptomyces sp. SID5910 TaxID=2690312 RepID=UPI00137139D3|nr:hypothetical protein [Streptomyces sp. SID5910]MYR45619.1 hypothetical protein [Streptomyces sp. SID5910]
MWPGEQSSAGGPHSGQPNPYQQPGYQQPAPHPGQQPPAPWNAPTVTAGPPPSGGPGGRRTKVVAIVAASAVVVAAAVAGVVLLGGGEDEKAEPEPAASSASAPSPSGDARNADGAPRPTVSGWSTVVNTGLGIAFDVPASWKRQSPDWVSFVTDDKDPEDKPLIGMKAPAVLQEEWCASDDDKDGSVDHTPLASAGTRGNNGARSTEEIARADSAQWVYGAFTQPDRKKITTEPVVSFTTASGITGSLATSRSAGVTKRGKCDVDGKATTFAFKSADGDLLSWSFVGAARVGDEVPDATVRQIAGTVREFTPSDS